jgi:hypothetical protein
MLEELLRNIVGIVCKLLRLVETEMQCTEVRKRESALRIRRRAWPPNLDELRRLCADALEQDSDLRSDLTDAESWAAERTPSEGGPLTQDEAFAAWVGGDSCLDKLKLTLTRYQAKAKTSEQTGAGSNQCGAGQGEGNNKGVEKPLKPSREKVHRQFSWAMEQKPELKTDRKVYDWLTDHADAAEGLLTFATWSKYLREARAHYNDHKHTPRTTKAASGKSVVRRDQI